MSDQPEGLKFKGVDNTLVMDLSQRFATDPRVRQMMENVRVFALVADSIGLVMAQLSHKEQRVLAELISFRVQGEMMPMTLMLKHFPMMRGFSDGEVVSHVGKLVDAGVLVVMEHGKDADNNPQKVLQWPALERLLSAGAEQLAKPQILTPEG